MPLDHDPHAGPVESELLDRIDALRVLRADRPQEKGRLLEEIPSVAIPPRRLDARGAVLVNGAGR